MVVYVLLSFFVHGVISYNANNNYICSLVASTNIHELPNFSKWECNSSGIPITDPCGTEEVRWPNLVCTDYGTDGGINEIVITGEIMGTIPPDLFYLTDLEFVYLYDNYFYGSIPSTICQLTTLQVFVFNYNMLTQSIPTCIGSMTHMDTLSLSNNQLTGSIPPSIGDLKHLSFLILSDNSLEYSIPTALAECTIMIDIVLSYNRLTGIISHYT